MMRLLLVPLFLTATIFARCHAGSFSIPSNCNQTCSFRVSWVVIGDQVKFSVLAAVQKGVWAGIGFSKDQMMGGSDAVVAWMTKTGSMVVTDRFLFAKSPIAVPVDETNNVDVTSFAQDEDVLTFAFTRDIVTGDSEDLDLDKPFYLLYAYGGDGGDDGVSITKHTTSGVVPNMVSLDMSADPTAFVTAMVVPMPSTVSSLTQSAPGTTTEIGIPSTASTTARTTMSPSPSTTQETAETIVMRSLPMEATKVTTTVSLNIVATDSDDVNGRTVQGIEDLINIEEGPFDDRRSIPELRTTAPDTKAPTQTNVPTMQSTTITPPIQTSKFVPEKTCTTVKCPRNSHCVVQHGIARCYCDNGFSIDKNGNCMVKSTQILKTCDEIKCPTHSTCEDGVCICQPGYVMSLKRCIASTSGRDKCTGVKCEVNSRCMNGFCVCQSGYKFENGKCIGTKISDNKCSGIKCPQNAECKRGYCFCKSQYFNLKGQCRKISDIRNPCENVKCSDNAICLKGRCQCTQGHSRTIDGKCLKVLFDKCSNVKCSENAACSDGVCSCNAGYIEQNDGSCKILDKCSSVNCSENAACNNGVCSCNAGYAQQNDGTCKKPTQNKCANIKCIENAECTKGYCFCKPGYTYTNRKCRAANPCATVKCVSNSICVNGICVCKKGYTAQKDGGCKAPAPTPTDKCQRIRCPDNAACKNGFCFCNFGFVHKAGQCVAMNRPKVCENINCPENSHCRVNKCYCKTGYVSSNRKCIRIGSNTCTRINCGPHGRCVIRNGRSGCEFSNRGSQYGNQNQYSSTSHSCRNKCGKYDYVRRCSCSNACRQTGNCCSDYRSNCGATHGYYFTHG